MTRDYQITVTTVSVPTSSGKFRLPISWILKEKLVNTADAQTGLNIFPTVLSQGVWGLPYHQELVVNGGTGPYTWVTAGSMPPGLVLTNYLNSYASYQTQVGTTPPIYQLPPAPGSGGGAGSGTGTGGGGGGVTCTVICEDRVTGQQYPTGPSGCQGTGYSGPPGTRQVQLCSNPGTPTDCGSGLSFDQAWFYLRNCQEQLDSIRIGNSNNFDTSGLPTSQTSAPAGTLYTTPNEFDANSPSRTIRCSYGNLATQQAAISCFMPMSGGFCEPFYAPVGCTPKP